MMTVRVVRTMIVGIKEVKRRIKGVIMATLIVMIVEGEG